MGGLPWLSLRRVIILLSDAVALTFQHPETGPRLFLPFLVLQLPQSAIRFDWSSSPPRT